MIKAKRKELKAAYIRKGINQKELSEQVDLKHTTLSLLTNGRIGASPKSAKKICTALEAQFDDLFEIV